jgi:hypothetical protein
MSDIDNNISGISANDLIFNMDKDGGIYSGGFSVNSIMMKAGMSPIMTINTGQYGGSNNVSDLFNDLVIPNWAITYNNKTGGGTYKDNDSDNDSDDDIDDDLHDKLLELVKEHDNKLKKENKRKTRKQIINKNGGTRKCK